MSSYDMQYFLDYASFISQAIVPHVHSINPQLCIRSNTVLVKITIRLVFLLNQPILQILVANKKSGAKKILQCVDIMIEYECLHKFFCPSQNDSMQCIHYYLCFVLFYEGV